VNTIVEIELDRVDMLTHVLGYIRSSKELSIWSWFPFDAVTTTYGWFVVSSLKFKFCQQSLPSTGNTWYRSQKPISARWL